MKLRNTSRRGITAALALATVVAAPATYAGSTHGSALISANLGAKRLAVETSTVDTTTASSAWVNVPNAATRIVVPSTQTAAITANFFAESFCGGSTGWCPVRILINSTEMSPQSGTDFAFAAPGDSWAGNSMERVYSSAPGGTYTITVQYCVTAGATSFRLDDWTLHVEEWRQT